MPSLGYRLRIRNADDTADELVISSVGPDTGDATNRPYLTDVPSVDGASADLIAGTVDVGTSVFRFFDEPVAPVAADVDIGSAGPFGAHSFWRVLVLGSSNDDTSGAGASIGELQFRATPGGPSLSIAGTPRESGHGFVLAAANAFDGTMGDGLDAWGAGTVPDADGFWLGYETLTPVAVGAVWMMPRSGEPLEAPTDFDVQYRDGVGAWVTSWSVRRSIGWADGVARVFYPGAAFDAWRVRVDATDEGADVGIGEMAFRYRDVNVTSGGAAIESGHEFVLAAANAFNGTRGDGLDAWGMYPASGAWCGYVFPGPQAIDAVTIAPRSTYPEKAPTRFTIDARDADGVWHPQWRVDVWHFIPSFWLADAPITFDRAEWVARLGVPLV